MALKDQDEADRAFVRKFPKFILINPELKQKLFSKEEYEHLVKIAKEEQEKQKRTKKITIFTLIFIKLKEQYL